MCLQVSAQWGVNLFRFSSLFFFNGWIISFALLPPTVMNEGRIEAYTLIWDQCPWQSVLLPLTLGGLMFTLFHHTQTGDILPGHIYVHTPPQSIVVSGRCRLTYWSTILWCLCADNAIYWPHKSAGFYKRGGERGALNNKLMRSKGQEGVGMGRGCANFS